MLGRRLSKSFGSVQIFRRFFFPISQVLVHSGEYDFIVSIGREKLKGQTDGEWCVAVNPRGYPVPLKSLPEDEERKYSRDLMRISGELHSQLTSMPEVTGLRWFFEGWDVRKPAVRTPAELPWDVRDPELSGAESRKLS